jgi:hypothetical protein
MKEALKLARMALEDFADATKYEHEQDDIGRRACCDELSYAQHSENCNAIKAITAIEQALAQPAQEPDIYPEEARDMGLEAVAYYTAPPAAQPAPDCKETGVCVQTGLACFGQAAQPAPVQGGWISVPVTLTNDMTSAMADALEDPDNERSSWDLAENMWRAVLTKAPTPPAAPVQQPLTPEQREEIYAKSDLAMRANKDLRWRDAIVNYVEAAHGIKENT